MTAEVIADEMCGDYIKDENQRNTYQLIIQIMVSNLYVTSQHTYLSVHQPLPYFPAVVAQFPHDLELMLPRVHSHINLRAVHHHSTAPAITNTAFDR